MIIELVGLRFADARTGRPKLVQQGWTLCPLFNQTPYLEIGLHQLPVFQGVPSAETLRSCLDGDPKTALSRLLQLDQIRLESQCSVILQLADCHLEEGIGIDETVCDQMLDLAGSALKQRATSGNPLHSQVGGGKVHTPFLFVCNCSCGVHGKFS